MKIRCLYKIILSVLCMNPEPEQEPEIKLCSQKIFMRTGKRFKDDIKNYRKLTKQQTLLLDSLTEKEKIEIIYLYDLVLSIVIQLV